MEIDQVRRKIQECVELVRARGIKICCGTFNIDYDYEKGRWFPAYDDDADGEACCPLGAVLVEQPGSCASLVGDALTDALGLTTNQTWAFVYGFDGRVNKTISTGDPFYKLGAELRKVYVE